LLLYRFSKFKGRVIDNPGNNSDKKEESALMICSPKSPLSYNKFSGREAFYKMTKNGTAGKIQALTTRVHRNSYAKGVVSDLCHESKSFILLTTSIRLKRPTKDFSFMVAMVICH